MNIRQSIEDTEEEIVQRSVCPLKQKSFHVFLLRSVESVDNLFNMDKQLQARLGIKVDQTGRSL